MTHSTTGTYSEFSDITFPFIKNVVKSTLSEELIFGDKEKMENIEKRIEIENRNNKIDSVLKNKKYVEKDYKKDSEWIKESKKGIQPISGPSGNLFYLDFQYGTQSN